MAGLAGMLLCAGAASATTLPAGFSESTIAGGLSVPTAVAYAPDGRAFVTEKAGRVRVISPQGVLQSTPLLSITNKVNSFSDRGMLGIATDRDFASNGFLYLLYVYELRPLTPDTDAPMVSTLTRVKVNPNNTLENPSNPEVPILGTDVSAPCPVPDNTRDCIPADYKWHTIGTVRSDPVDGTLWVGNGDSHDPSPAVAPDPYRTYDPASLSGKIIHIDRNGQGLEGHPFCPTETNLSRTCTKVYATGFRNPFRFHLRPGKGPVVGDVGHADREELNFVRPGRNYGWPCWEGTVKPGNWSSQPRCQQEYANPTGAPYAPPAWDYAHGDGASITAGPVYTGSTYPTDYQGDVFVGDYVQGWIKRIEIDANDNVTAVNDWASAWTGGVDLEMHPSGDLSYIDIGFGGGAPSLKRFSFSGSTNGAPTARASATPTSGPAPLNVQLRGDTSSDPDSDALTYDWDFGDGSTHSTLANPTHTYTASGSYTATLTVADGHGHSDTETVNISVGTDQAPTATISAPADESGYRDGQTINLSGSGSDPEDGPLTGGSLTWHVLLHHGTHIHEVTSTLTGTNPSFTTFTDHDSDSFYEIRLTATDSGGRTNTKVVEIRPETSNLELASSPAGAPISYDGQAPQAAPFSRQPAIGYNAQLIAPETFVRSNRTYRFHSWSDGGARQHAISVPQFSPQYTASYRADGVHTLIFNPVADTHVDNLNPTTSYGTETAIEVDASPEMRQAFMKFNVSGIGGRQVVGARLSLRQVDAPDGSVYGGDVHAVANTSWTETTNWNGRPALGAKLAGFGPALNGRRYEADLGAGAVAADGLLSLGMRTDNSDGSLWGSRESASPPQLIVEVEKRACEDGIDNDGDGSADHPSDPGCTSLTDNSENQPPVADAGATPTSGAAPLEVDFSSSGSTDPEDDDLDYSWNFGDGSAPSTAANPSHTYTSPGTYTATLTVDDGHGLSDTDTVQIVVSQAPACDDNLDNDADGNTDHPDDPGCSSLTDNSENQPPVADAGATPTSGTAPLNVQLSSSGSTDPEDDDLGYSWNFGDGSAPSTAANPSHTYTSPGTYTATLTVDDGHGLSDTDTVQIVVSQAPACDDNLDNDGDGNTDHPDDPGCTSAADGDENEAPTALAGATPTSGDAPLEVDFDGSGSSDPEDDDLTYSWDFGDGSAASAAESPSHTYDEPGTYTAELTVEDESGLEDSASVEITVDDPPAEEEPPPTGGGDSGTNEGSGSNGGTGGTTDQPAPPTLEDILDPPAFSGAGIGDDEPVSLRRGVASFELDCAADTVGACAGELVLTAKAPAAAGSAAKARRIRLGSKRFSIAPGRTRKVNVRITKAGRRLLALHRRLRVKAVATSRDGLGRPHVTRATLVLRLPPPRRSG